MFVPMPKVVCKLNALPPPPSFGFPPIHHCHQADFYMFKYAGTSPIKYSNAWLYAGFLYLSRCEIQTFPWPKCHFLIPKMVHWTIIWTTNYKMLFLSKVHWSETQNVCMYVCGLTHYKILFMSKVPTTGINKFTILWKVSTFILIWNHSFIFIWKSISPTSTKMEILNNQSSVN